MRRWLYVPATGGFPALDATGDTFDDWVSAAATYVGTNSLQAETGSPTHYHDSNTNWSTSGSYRYLGNAINGDGIITFAPQNEEFYSLDSTDGTVATFDHPTYSITAGDNTYWRSTTAIGYMYEGVCWAPNVDRFYFSPKYAYRYASWSGSNPGTASEWDGVARTQSNGASSTSFQRRGMHPVYDNGYVYFFPEQGVNSTFVSVLDTSDHSVSTALPANFPSTTTDHVGVCMGPDNCAYAIGNYGVYKFGLSGTTVTYELVKQPSDVNASWTYFMGEYVDRVTYTSVGYDGSLYAFPSSRSSSGSPWDINYAIQFDPATETVTRHAMTATNFGLFVVPSQPTSTQKPVLMPDGRFMISTYYSWNETDTGFNYTVSGFGPRFWSIANKRWEGPSGTANPWGTYARQWGLHWGGVVGADGAFYPSPGRISAGGQYGNPLSYYAYAGRFSDAADNAPPAEFYASRFH